MKYIILTMLLLSGCLSINDKTSITCGIGLLETYDDDRCLIELIKKEYPTSRIVNIELDNSLGNHEKFYRVVLIEQNKSTQGTYKELLFYVDKKLIKETRLFTKSYNRTVSHYRKDYTVNK